jgi:hypothetical protein
MDSTIREIRATIEAIDNQTALYEETNFAARAEALDFLESGVLDRIESLLLKSGPSDALTSARQDAEAVRTRLERVDQDLFRDLRQTIASGSNTSAELAELISRYAGRASGDGDRPVEEYDSLDALVNGLLLTEDPPQVVSPRNPEMFAYQPTPARIVLEMVEALDFGRHDLFCDIGSGLGQVSILVHLLGGVPTRGVEIEPGYCDYARRCAQGLNLSQVEFINADAREADLSEATVFFLYTPFQRRMLEQVLGRLEHESKKRPIRLCTYGPCTPHVARQAWLERLDDDTRTVDGLAGFRTAWELPSRAIVP